VMGAGRAREEDSLEGASPTPNWRSATPPHLWDRPDSVCTCSTTCGPTPRTPRRQHRLRGMHRSYSEPRGHRQPRVARTEWVAGMRARRTGCWPGVGFDDLPGGRAVRVVLAAHVDDGQDRFRGVRQPPVDRQPRIRPAHTSPPPGLMQRRCSTGSGRLGREASASSRCYFTQLAEYVDARGPARSGPDRARTTSEGRSASAPTPNRPRRGHRVGRDRAGRSGPRAKKCPQVGGIGIPNGADWQPARRRRRGRVVAVWARHPVP